MIRGTAQPFRFKLPYPLDDLVWITIQFWQDNNPDKTSVVTKTKVDCVEQDGAVYVSLSANDTKKFSDRYKVAMQLRAQPLYGVPFGSKPKLYTVYPMSDGIIDSDTENDSPAQTNEKWIILDGDSII